VHAIIAGCGRVGAYVATELADDGHDVVIIDKDETAFRRLGEDFKGTTLRGIVFDRETLEEARIRQASAFIAVTSGDNSNIVSARTAKERYAVDRVVARIYDPARAEIFERMGVTIIASARWTAESILRQLAPPEDRVEGLIGHGVGDVLLLTLQVPESAHGVPATALSAPGRSVLAAITRAGNTVVPPLNALLEADDLVHLSVERVALDEVRHEVSLLGVEEH
jgi:trk/ktr system potassium uptake protein